jgi:hypothetical protein
MEQRKRICRGKAVRSRPAREDGAGFCKRVSGRGELLLVDEPGAAARGPD